METLVWATQMRWIQQIFPSDHMGGTTKPVLYLQSFSFSLGNDFVIISDTFFMNIVRLQLFLFKHVLYSLISHLICLNFEWYVKFIAK